jgi:CO/xanthine dehydrogenase FAD-binding subunit
MCDMKLSKPDTLNDALDLLSGRNARLIAGGTDIIPGLRQGSKRFKTIRHLIDIHHLPELRFINRDKDILRIGAAVTFSRLSEDKLIEKHVPVLAEAARHIGSVQIRNRATIAGNFVNNAPCADSVPSLLVHNARIKIVSGKNQRTLSLEKFLKGPYHTALKNNELVTEIQIPMDTTGYKGIFYKLGRRRGVAVSRISMAILAQMSKGMIHDIRLASGAVTPVGMRFSALEKEMTGQEVSTVLLKQCAHQLGKEILSVTGLRWSTPYKLPVLQKVFYQLLHDLTGKTI